MTKSLLSTLGEWSRLYIPPTPFEGIATIRHGPPERFTRWNMSFTGSTYIISINVKDHHMTFPKTDDKDPTSKKRARNIDELVRQVEEGKQIYVRGKHIHTFPYSSQSSVGSKYKGTIEIDGKPTYEFIFDIERLYGDVLSRVGQLERKRQK